MKIKIIIAFVLLVVSQNVLAIEKPLIPKIDRIRLAEAFRIADQIGNRVWANWDKAPFAVLLVTPEYEFLIRHSQPSTDFVELGYDSLLKSTVFFRKRINRIDLLATFPAIDGSNIPTIVVGEAENTAAKTSTPWTITLLHEHFHQLQMSQPDYQTSVEALDLTGGDQTGMWMLNFAFAYDDKTVQQQFEIVSRLLVEAIAAGQNRRAKLQTYLAARHQFEQTLSAADYKYFSFQLWQEGIARYTEHQIAKLAAARYKPSKSFSRLKDFTEFAVVADSIRREIFEELKTQRLESSRRVMFYPFGAAEGLLLDVVNPTWRNRYFEDQFDLSKSYQTSH